MAHTIRSSTGRGIRAAAVALGLLALASGFSGPARAQEIPPGGERERLLEESPPGEVLVVDANLLEAFGQPDVEDSADMGNFVRRLLTQMPYAPDALLLQEVVGPSTENVARLMTETTGDRYAVVSAPGESHVVVPATADSPEIRRETAIVLNLDTMRLDDAGGRVELAYAREDHGSGTWMTKQEPYLLAMERRGGLRSALVSLHYVPNSRFDSQQTGFEYKRKWSEQIAELIDARYGSPSQRQVEILSGDFNNRPCVEVDVAATDPSCTPMPYWRTLTESFGYSAAKDSGIDHIFARGRIVESGWDESRKEAVGSDREFQQCKALYTEGRSDLATGTCATEFYADHSFVWALVGMR